MDGYTKLAASIITSTVWRAPDHVRLVWITMLAIKTQHGEVLASIPGLAAVANVTIDACEQALEALASPDRYSRTKTHEGRRIAPIDGGWVVLNHGKYRRLASEEERRERDAERKRLKREADRLSADSPQSSAIVRNVRTSDADADADADAEESAAPRAHPHGEQATYQLLPLRDELEPGEPEPGGRLRAGDVAQAWCEASAGQIFASNPRAYAAFEAMAETFEREAAQHARTACWAYLHWVFSAPDGPVRAGRLRRPRPWALQPGVAEDLPAAQSWLQALSDTDRERVLPSPEPAP